MIEPRTYGEEPTLAETLDDPIIQQMMLSDGVTPSDLLQLIAVARRGTPGDEPGLSPRRVRAVQ